jgi:organic hydroperoxide reductase OsmC/OhrA
MAGERNLKDIVERRMEFFRRKPEAALYRPRASSRHIRDLYTETTVREHTVKVDYAEAAGGSNLAPNPIELLLASLAACIESAFYEFAVHRGFTVNALSVDVEGTIDLRAFGSWSIPLPSTRPMTPGSCGRWPGT